MRRAKRSLSQSFLVDPNLQRRIVRELKAGARDAVLEVGSGHGELTRHLVGGVGRLVLVEKDDDLARGLHDVWGERADVRIVHGDALEVDLSTLLAEAVRAAAGENGDAADVDATSRPAGAARALVLSNVPYSITSPLVLRLLDLRTAPDRIVLTVQAEVAERMAAAPGGREYGALTVAVQVRARVRIAFRVSRHAFRPVPDVESATVVLEPRPDRPDTDALVALRRLTRAAFARRRKQLQKILRTAPEYDLPAERAREVCAAVGLDPRVRPQRIPPGDWLRLAGRLSCL